MITVVFGVPKIFEKTSEIKKNFLEFEKKTFYTFEKVKRSLSSNNKTGLKVNFNLLQ